MVKTAVELGKRHYDRLIKSKNIDNMSIKRFAEIAKGKVEDIAKSNIKFNVDEIDLGKGDVLYRLEFTDGRHEKESGYTTREGMFIALFSVQYLFKLSRANKTAVERVFEEMIRDNISQKEVIEFNTFSEEEKNNYFAVLFMYSFMKQALPIINSKYVFVKKS